MKQRDIFAGKYCLWVFGLIAFFIIADILTPNNISSILWIVFFLILGSSCLYNYKKCGRIHCKITGIGFIIVAVLIMLTVLEIVTISDNYLLLLITIIVLVGYGIEYHYKSKTGSCYKK